MRKRRGGMSWGEGEGGPSTFQFRASSFCIALLTHRLAQARGAQARSYRSDQCTCEQSRNDDCRRCQLPNLGIAERNSKRLSAEAPRAHMQWQRDAEWYASR